MSVESATHQSRFRVAATHPALPGHFPGAPVVPGVLVLEHVLEAAEAWLARPVHARGLAQCKFLAPLLPGDEARVQLDLAGTSLRFVVTRAAETIAQGAFTLAAETAP